MPFSRRAFPPALALGLVLLAGCEDVEEGFSCPGVPAGRFHFVYSDPPAGVDVGGTVLVSGCVPRQGQGGEIPAGIYVPPNGSTLPEFDATITLEGADDAAFCASSSTRFGTRTGADLAFADATFDGAVLSANEAGQGVCGTACPVRLVQRLGGTLCGGPDWPPCPVPGASVEFHGYVVDEFEVPEAVAGGPTYDCAPCSGTCRGVWLLTGTSLP